MLGRVKLEFGFNSSDLHLLQLPDFPVIQRFLKRLLDYRLKDFEIAHHAEFPAEPPIFGKLSSPLPPLVEDALLKLGISSLYSHQATALEHIRSGPPRHPVENL
jgi:ATP-dependent helicase YprA (DUF1998 family)